MNKPWKRVALCLGVEYIAASVVVHLRIGDNLFVGNTFLLIKPVPLDWLFAVNKWFFLSLLSYQVYFFVCLYSKKKNKEKKSQTIK